MSLSRSRPPIAFQTITETESSVTPTGGQMNPKATQTNPMNPPYYGARNGVVAITTKGAWTIEIPDWTPASLNEGRNRKHWQTAEQIVHTTCALAKAYAINAGITLTSESYRPRRELLITVYKHYPHPDPDNLLKFLLDGLVRARIIWSDSQQYCAWSRPVLVATVPKIRERTVLTVADIAPLHDVCANAQKPVFSRAVVEYRKPLQISGGQPHWDFFLCYDYAGYEEVWMCSLATHRSKMERLIAWAATLGISVEYDPPGCFLEPPKPVSQPSPNPVEDFW